MTGGTFDDASDSIVVGNDLAELTRVARWVDAWSRRNEVPARTAERIDLCSAEIVTNVVTHAYPDRSAHEIVLRLERRGSHFSLQVEDDGMAFDPLQVPEPTPVDRLEDATVGGLGLRIVRGLSDEQRYDRSGNRNSLTLTFRMARE